MSASACDSDGVEGIHGKQGVQGVGPLRRNRDFQLLWGGQAVSLLGSQTSKIAYPLLVLAMTGSPAKAGIAGFAAQRAALPMLVHPSQRSVAVGQNEARQNAAQLAGPALGGALFGLSRAAPFAADAVSYLASLVTLPFIKAPMQAGPLVSHAGSGGFRAGSRRFRASVGRLRAELGEGLGEGLAWTWRQPFLRYSAFFAASVNVLLQVLTLGLIVLARHDGAAPAEVGVIVACMGAGGLAGAFAAPWFQQRVPVGIAITGCMWIWTVLLALIVVIRVPLWLCPVVTMFGFVGPSWNVSVQTYRMRITPNHLLGRTSSVALQIGWGVIPLGSLLAGFLLQALSPSAAMTVVVAGMAVTAATATALAPIRQAGRRDQPRPSRAPAPAAPGGT